jgi:flagellar hook-length control protein FliK
MVSGATDDGGKPAAAKERGAEAGPTFEDALAKVKPTHREPEADSGLGVQAATRGPDETEAAERTAAPYSRGAAPHSAADQVSVQLGKAVPGKNDQMVINLKPVELGSVEVRLDFGADGRVQASIMAERPETLEMLQKDQRALERALNDAGLQTDAGSLSFNLKGQGQGGNQRQFAGYNQPGAGRGKGFAGMDIEGPAIPDFAAPQYSASGANRNRLDIRI